MAMIEDGEDAIALALGIEVGQHGGGEDAEGGLANTDETRGACRRVQ
jgi:hypothetical protein